MSTPHSPQALVTGPHGSMLLRPKQGLQLKFRPSRPSMSRTFSSKCMLCPGNHVLALQETDSIGNGNWKARCISTHYGASGTPPAHQIVIPTPVHNAHLSTLPIPELISYFSMVSRAYARIRNVQGILNIFAFTKENLFQISHPHTHVIGSYEPNSRTIAASKMLQHGSCYFCQINEKPLNAYSESAALNILAQNDHFFALCPPDAQYEYQISIISKAHVHSLGDFSQNSLKSLAEIFKLVAGALDKITGVAPLKVRFFSTLPASGHEFHFHITLAPRIVPYDGFERHQDFAVLIAPPQQRAHELREAILTLKSP